MSSSGFGSKTKAQLIDRILGKKMRSGGAESTGGSALPGQASSVPEAFTRFDRHPGYEKMIVPKAAAARLGLPNPFFKVHGGVAGATTLIEGHEYINFANYNYLGLAGHPAVNKAAGDAIDRYGTSASASRLVAKVVESWQPCNDVKALSPIKEEPEFCPTWRSYPANIFHNRK